MPDPWIDNSLFKTQYLLNAWTEQMFAFKSPKILGVLFLGCICHNLSVCKHLVSPIPAWNIHSHPSSLILCIPFLYICWILSLTQATDGNTRACSGWASLLELHVWSHDKPFKSAPLTRGTTVTSAIVVTTILRHGNILCTQSHVLHNRGYILRKKSSHEANITAFTPINTVVTPLANVWGNPSPVPAMAAGMVSLCFMTSCPVSPTWLLLSHSPQSLVSNIKTAARQGSRRFYGPSLEPQGRSPCGAPF